MRRAALVLVLLVTSCASRPPDGSAGVGDRLPRDVQRLIDDSDGCRHFRGEEPYDAERAAFLNRQIERLCPHLKARGAALSAKYAGNAVILDAITGALTDD